MSKRVTNYQLMKMLETQQEKLDDIHECVFGNGNPEHGLVSRVGTLEAASLGKESHSAVFGGVNPSTGLVIRVRDLEEFVVSIKRMVWAAVLATIGSAVTLLISIVAR